MSRKSRYLRMRCRDRDRKSQQVDKPTTVQGVMDRIMAKQRKAV